jgi:hypothetical protein
VDVIDAGVDDAEADSGAVVRAAAGSPERGSANERNASGVRRLVRHENMYALHAVDVPDRVDAARIDVCAETVECPLRLEKDSRVDRRIAELRENALLRSFDLCELFLRDAGRASAIGAVLQRFAEDDCGRLVQKLDADAERAADATRGRECRVFIARREFSVVLGECSD